MERGREGEGTGQHNVVLNHYSQYMLIYVDICNPPYSPDTYRPLVSASVKQPHLTSSFEEVGYLGDADIVGHVRLTSGGRSPVNTDIVTLFEQSFQSIFT